MQMFGYQEAGELSAGELSAELRLGGQGTEAARGLGENVWGLPLYPTGQRLPTGCPGLAHDCCCTCGECSGRGDEGGGAWNARVGGMAGGRHGGCCKLRRYCECGSRGAPEALELEQERQLCMAASSGAVFGCFVQAVWELPSAAAHQHAAYGAAVMDSERQTARRGPACPGARRVVRAAGVTRGPTWGWWASRPPACTRNSQLGCFPSPSAMHPGWWQLHVVPPLPVPPPPPAPQPPPRPRPFPHQPRPTLFSPPPQIFFQIKYFLPDPIANDVKYQASAQPFLVFGLLTTGLAIGHVNQVAGL